MSAENLQRPCSKVARGIAHDPHTYIAGRYLPVGDLGVDADCPGYDGPPIPPPMEVITPTAQYLCVEGFSDREAEYIAAACREKALFDKARAFFAASAGPRGHHLGCECSGTSDGEMTCADFTALMRTMWVPE